MRVLLALLSMLALTATLSFAVGVGNVNSIEARALLNKNSRTVLLDVRTPEEYKQAHLRGSILIPLGELSKRVQEVPRDRPVLVYCAVGARSVSAAGFLTSKGYREVYNMTDGIVGWYRNGLPIEKGMTR